MTLPQYGPDYQKWKLAELRKLFVLRHDPGSIKGVKIHKLLKRTCVEALQTLDRNSTFRFLDLPAELRVMIYPLLLTYDRSDYHDGLSDKRKPKVQAFPAILRASKLCYKEGKDILLRNTTLAFELRCGRSRGGSRRVRQPSDVFAYYPGLMELKLFQPWEVVYDVQKSILAVQELRNITVILRNILPKRSHWKMVFSLMNYILSITPGKHALRLVKIKLLCGCASQHSSCSCRSVTCWKRWGCYQAPFPEPAEDVFGLPKFEAKPSFSEFAWTHLHAMVPKTTCIVFECFDEKAAARLQGLLPSRK